MGKAVEEGLQPSPICVGTVTLPRFDGNSDPRDLGPSELEILYGQRACGIPYDPLLTGNQFAFQSDNLLVLGREGELVLEGPERADRGDIAALGAEEGVEIQTLNVIELDLHGFV